MPWGDGAQPRDRGSANHPRSSSAIAGTLSDREREVLTLVADGASNKEIGQRLHLKEATIESYLSNILAKLNARSRTDAVKPAVQLGILVWDDGSRDQASSASASG